MILQNLQDNSNIIACHLIEIFKKKGSQTKALIDKYKITFAKITASRNYFCTKIEKCFEWKSIGFTHTHIHTRTHTHTHKDIYIYIYIYIKKERERERERGERRKEGRKEDRQAIMILTKIMEFSKLLFDV